VRLLVHQASLQFPEAPLYPNVGYLELLPASGRPFSTLTPSPPIWKIPASVRRPEWGAVQNSGCATSFWACVALFAPRLPSRQCTVPGHRTPL
jgi:hypothetical protein